MLDFLEFGKICPALKTELSLNMSLSGGQRRHQQNQCVDLHHSVREAVGTF